MTEILPTTDHVPRAFVPTLLVVGLVVSVVSSLGAPLIPKIAADFDTSIGAAQWSLTATLLVGAVVAPLVGRLGDGRHLRRVLIVCLLLVTLGGVLAAAAPSLPPLIAGRALQGLGLALMPVTVAAARDRLPLERAKPTIALLSVIGATGVGLGYPITGLLADSLGLAAAFWLGAAATAIAMLMVALFIPPPLAPANHTSLDLRGATLVGGGLLALLLAVEKGLDWGWGDLRTLALSTAAIILLALWTCNELRVPIPLVQLRLLRHPAVITANLTGLVLGVAMYLEVSLLAQLVQLPNGLAQTVLVAGLTLLPFSIMSALASGLEHAIARRTGPGSTIPIGAAAIAVGMIFLALDGTRIWQPFAVNAIVGLGLGLSFAAMPGLIVSAVPKDETGSAISFYQVTRYVGFSIGAGLAVTLLRAFSGDGPIEPSTYTPALIVGAAIALLAAALALIVPHRLRRRYERLPHSDPAAAP